MANYKYKVTVGMPVYGVEKYIKKCMLSVLNQTFKEEFEILAVDDLGPDNSVEIIKELQSSHPNGWKIKILKQPKNMGCWAARNRVLEEAQGEYIFLLDSDDYISEDCIEKLYTEAVNNHAEAVYGSVKPIDEKGNYKEIGQDYLHQPHIVFHEADGLARFANQYLHSTFRDYIWNTLIRHDFIDKYNIRFKQAKFCDDMICSADMTPLITDAVLIPDFTYYYVIRDNSLSNYQHRKTIKLDEIKESFRVYSYLKNKCRELEDKDYFETRCTKGMILMFYTICGALKHRDQIQPSLNNSLVKDAFRHPIKLSKILRFRKYRLINLVFFVIGSLPSPIFVGVIRIIGRIKHLI